MERRPFASASPSARAIGAADRTPAGVFELITYGLRPGKLSLLDVYLGDALVPTLRRLGVGPVGVFVELDKAGEAAAMIVLIVHPSAEAAGKLSARLSADPAYLKAAQHYLAAATDDPVCTGIERSLLTPIGGMPRLDQPDASKPREFNLRVDESPNEQAAKKKIETFNTGGLTAYRRVGLTPVFVGETVAGPAMPNLTYLLVFPDDAARDAAWARLKTDPEWLKMRILPGCTDKDLVSKTTNKTLVPTEYSEI